MAHYKMIDENGVFDNNRLIAITSKVNNLVIEAYNLGFNYGFDMALWLDKNGEESEELGQIKKGAEV